MARARAWAMVSCVLAAACSKEPTPSSAPAITVSSAPTPQDAPGRPPKAGSLYSFSNEPAGANCAQGGQALNTGADLNANGVLDPDEIVSRSYICNGVDGKTSVLSQAPEPIGTACPTGGQAISWGYDDNENGTLDAVEVKQTAYVCNGSAGANGANGKTGLVTVMPQPPNQHCAAGGQAIYSGLDVDGDGALQPTEVKNTTFVCNGAAGAAGANGTNALVRTVDEAPGGSCANGGVRVLAGTDVNGDGALADTEVTSTAYVCHGATGPSGPTGPAGSSPVVKLTAEPAGANCEAGGQRIDVGPDTNANGTLEMTEIAQTRYVCNGTSGQGQTVASLSRTQPLLAASAQCPLRGGVLVESGADTNADGVLQDAEVTSSVPVCGLARRAVYNDCGAAGVAVDYGVDSNVDGVLGEEEVTSSRCVGFRALTSRGDAMCAVLDDGTAWCWGDNTAARYTTGPVIASDTPKPVPRIAHARGIALNRLNGFAVTDNPAISAWDEAGAAFVPDIEAVAVTAGQTHVCALDVYSVVKCWQENFSYQVGELFGQWVYQPQTSCIAAAGVSAAGNGTCAVRVDGSVVCWGFSGFASSTSPTSVNGLPPGVASIATSPGGACAVMTDGTLACWGDPAVPAATQPGIANAVAVAVADGHKCVTSSSGALHCWGDNSSGQLGTGSLGGQVATPTQISGFKSNGTMRLDHNYSCAVSADNRMAYCWGSNAFGQLGRGGSATATSPVPVTFPYP